MQSTKFLQANQCHLQHKMAFWEVGAPLWAIKKELLNKRIATRNHEIFVVLRGLEVKTFRRVDGITYKRVCPQWEIVDVPDDIMLSEAGKSKRETNLAIPLVEGVVFRSYT